MTSYMPKSARWKAGDTTMQTISASSALDAAARIKLVMPTPTVVVDDFVDAGQATRWNGSKLLSLQPRELLRINWTVKVIVAQGARPLVAANVLAPGAALNLTLSNLTGMRGTSLADGSLSGFVQTTTEVGGASGVVGGHLQPVPVSADAALTLQPITWEETLESSATTVANGISLYLVSTVPCQVQLAAMLVIQDR